MGILLIVRLNLCYGIYFIILCGNPIHKTDEEGIAQVEEYEVLVSLAFSSYHCGQRSTSVESQISMEQARKIINLY